MPPTAPHRVGFVGHEGSEGNSWTWSKDTHDQPSPFCNKTALVCSITSEHGGWKRGQENEVRSPQELPTVLCLSLPLLLTPWSADPPHPHFSSFPFNNNPNGMSNTQQPTG